jgi:hypothetical protein
MGVLQEKPVLLAQCWPHILTWIGLELNLGLHSKKIAPIGLEFFGVLLKMLKDSFQKCPYPCESMVQVLSQCVTSHSAM